MKSLKEQLNEIANNSSLRKISSSELAALKRCILEMYIHVSKICERHHLTLMLTGGSCLGAVRHKGFIPWDDDLDLMMPREDYDKLLSLCERGVLGDEYVFTYPSKQHDSPVAFLKIYLKDSKIRDMNGSRKNYPEGVFIDIFPIEGTPENHFIRKCKGPVANLLRLFANMVDSSGKWSKEETAFYKQSKSLYVNMKCRQVIGKLLSVFSHKRWICLYDSFVKDKRKSSFSSIPTGRKLYLGETLPSSVYFPPSNGMFEGISVKLPADTDAYLKNLYGNYMWIPPVEKRESHMITELSLPSKYYQDSEK